MRYEYLTNEPLDRALSAYTQALGTLTRRTERVRVGRPGPHHQRSGIRTHLCTALQCLGHGRHCAQGVHHLWRDRDHAADAQRGRLRGRGYRRSVAQGMRRRGHGGGRCRRGWAEEAVRRHGPWEQCAADRRRYLRGGYDPHRAQRGHAGGHGRHAGRRRNGIERVCQAACRHHPDGDEIVLPCADPGEGDILEFNSTIFTGMLTKWGRSARRIPSSKTSWR